jgi:hypothetical protein
MNWNNQYRLLPIRINGKSNQYDLKGAFLNISVENKFYKWEISPVSASILKLTILKQLYHFLTFLALNRVIKKIQPSNANIC